MKIIPKIGWIVIKKIEIDNKTDSGIYISSKKETSENAATVVRVAEGMDFPDVGQQVIFDGVPVSLPSGEYMLNENAIIGYVEE